MGVAELFSEPYFEGTASTLSEDFTTDIALGGHGYMINWLSEIPLRHVSIPILRQQQDTSESPGEQSINSEGLWRRFGESWHLGAGQERFDRKESSEFRFNTSQGVNIWDRWRLSLLKDTSLFSASASTDQRMAVAGDYLYYGQATVLKYTQDLSASTTVTGTPATNVSSIATNGYHVWTAHGANGIYRTTRGAAATAAHITGTVTKVAYVKNRVMAAATNSIYDVTSLAVGGGGALPAALFTHGNSDFTWDSFAESQGFIYAAGHSGDKSLIYSITITPEGTALSAPTVAGTLPEGEVVSAVYGYLGRFLAIGSNKGFRLGLVGSDGGLTIGALIETTSAVQCFEGQEEFIWFGMTNFTSAATGLGRFSTALFSDTDRLTPSYASDLMASTQGAVINIATFLNRRVFSVSGVGIYTEHATNLVSTGHLDTGAISYGMTDPKIALYVDVQMEDQTTTTATVEVFMSVDGADFDSLQEATYAELTTMSANEKAGGEFELRIKLDRDTDATKALVLLSWLLRSQPRPLVTNMIYCTIFLAPLVENLLGNEAVVNTLTELDFIEGLNLTKQITNFQQTRRSYSVVVEDYEFNVIRLVDSTDGMLGYNADCTLKLKRV